VAGLNGRQELRCKDGRKGESNAQLLTGSSGKNKEGIVPTLDELLEKCKKLEHGGVGAK